MSVFRSEREGRLRAPWRLAITGVLLLVSVVALTALVSPIVRPFVSSEAETPSSAEGAFVPPAILLSVSLATLGASFLSVWVAAHYLDRRRFRDLGLRLTEAWWADCAFGLALGVIAIGAVFAVEVAIGWVSVKGFGGVEGGAAFVEELLISMIAFGAVGVYEELLARGYVMKNIAESLNWRAWGASGGIYAGWILSSLIFALPHAFNPGASVMGIVNIFASAMLLLGLAYALTGRLGLSIGLHISWNFAQGFLFGLPTSGASVGHYPIVMTQQIGPDLWTGGAFGIEGGLLGTVAVLLAFAGILVWVRAREGGIRIHVGIARWMGDGGTADSQQA